jgi:hypothetical protein
VRHEKCTENCSQKILKKILFGRSRCSYENNINVDLKDIRCGIWTGFFRLWIFVDMSINIQFLKERMEMFTLWTSIRLWRRSLLHKVK